jgi:hypothetical protein
MTVRTLGCALAALLLSAPPAPAAGKAAYSIKAVADAEAPKELAEPVRKLLAKGSVQLRDAKGTLLAEVWFRKGTPLKATEAQVKNGLTYREVPPSTMLGALRVPATLYDYRKQKIPAGVYTLRLAQQPMDGDHMGTAPYSEFLLASPAAEDKKPDLMEAKSLQELSAKATDSHPAVFLLFPGKGATAEPKLVDKGSGHWVVLVNLEVTAAGKKATLPLGLALIGTSASA